MNRKIILFLVTGILFLNLLKSCSGRIDIDNKVRLKPTSNEKLNLGKVFKIIQLENTEESTLETIRKTAIDLKNNRIFVLSDFNIYIFDAKGKYITKLKKGRGPGEISRIISFSLNKEKKIIYAAQDLGNLITLIDYNGSIVKNYRLINYYFQAVEKIDEHNVLLLNNTASKTDPWFIGKYNLDKEFITQRFIPSEQSKYPLLSFTMNNNFMSFENRLFFAYSSIFGIYEYKENKFQKILSYDLGEREVPKKFQKEFEKGRRMAVFRDEAKRNGYVPYLKSTFFFKNYNLVILDDNKFSCYAISDNLKNVYLNGTIPEYFDLPNVRSLRNPVEVDSAFITFSCEPLDFFEANEVDADKQIQIGEHTIKLNYNSNPFLVIVK